MSNRALQLGAANGLLLKIAFGCAFLLLMIFWQQYYFRAIDDAENGQTTLWNWPTIGLLVLGAGALLLSALRFLKSKSRS